MRPLGFGETTTGGVHETGTYITYSMKLALPRLVEIWSERETPLMVLISLMLQFLLLFTGNLRRRGINGLLRVTVWLAYVGADSVAVYAIGLFSRYEVKYKLRSDSPGDTLPFLWAPFLLVHLGGQDTITAFSIEDNNLWLRHLLNLIIQVSLALYVFWKSIDIIDLQLLVIAMLIFVAGIIKYGERTWALNSGSRDSLGNPSSNCKKEQNSGDVMASYARNTVLCGKGLFVGRTLYELGDEIWCELVPGFAELGKREGKLKIIKMELGMMYDLLYTKALVLQSRTGIILRCVAQISMEVAFVLFLASVKHSHNRVNVAITYMLFVGAIFMEACSVSMVIVSPWTRAHLKKGTFLCWLSRRACSLFEHKKMQQGLPCSMGQFNLTDYCLSEKSTPKLFSKVVSAIGLKKLLRNLWHIKHTEDKEIIDHIERLFHEPVDEKYRGLNICPKLNFVLNLPLEHALFGLHIFTDLRISGLAADQMTLVARECTMLSNYLMYLMAVHPSMLPVSSAAQDIGPVFAEWVRDNCGTETKLEILKKYAEEKLNGLSTSPFESASLEYIKEVLVRLIVYMAGKCPGELHARQLGNGGGLLTSVWLLMMHHHVGDVGWELDLLKSDQRRPPIDSNWILQPRGPLYAFEFHGNPEDTSSESQGASEPSQIDEALEIEQGDVASEIEQAHAADVASEIEQADVAPEMEQAGWAPEIEQGDVAPEIEQKDKAGNSAN